MKIGIIGSNGFLGLHFRRVVLDNGYNLEKISFRNKEKKLLLTLFKNNFKKIHSCDFIINCCAAKNPQNKYDRFINSKLPRLIQSYINRNKIECKLIHISTMNVFFKFLDDDYTLQKKKAEDNMNNNPFLIVRPGLIWDSNGKGDSMIFKNFLEIPLPFHFMVNPGNIYRPICPSKLAELIINNIKNPIYYNELNVLGDRVLSLFELFKTMASKMKKRVMSVNPIILFWLKFTTINKTGYYYTLSQQINSYDRTGDTLAINDIVYLKFDI